MAGIKKALRNSTYIISSKLFSRLVYTAFVIYAAARLGPAVFGALSFALVMVELGASVGDMGLTRYGSRELVRDWDQRAMLSGIILALELLTSLVFSLAGAAIVMLAVTDATQRDLLLLGMGAVMLSGLVNTAESLFIATENFFYASLFNVTGRVAFVGTGFLVLLREDPVAYVMLCYIGGVALESVMRMYYVRRKFTRFAFGFTRSQLFSMLRKSLPFALAAAASIAFLQSGIIILKLLSDDASVGVFNVANTLFMPFLWIAVTLGRTTFPSLVALHKADPDVARGSTRDWYRLMSIGGIPVAALVTVLATPLLSHFPQGYEESAAVLQILIWSLPLMLISTIDFNVLQVVNQEAALSRALVVTTLMTIPLGFVLISLYGVKGAALAVLGGSMIRFLQFHIQVCRTFLKVNILKLLLKPAIAGLALIACSMALRNINIWAAAIVGMAAYGAVILVTGAVRMNELKALARRG
ncbi:MAG: oligosaccharide flippase family protein [Thermoleophilia bacterium]